MRSSIAARLAATLAIVAFTSTGMAVEITHFEGGDPGEGVDFEGDFKYAVNIFGPGGQTIGDASFSEDEDTDGFFVESTHTIIDWANPEYGDSDADDDLEEIMQSIRWTNVPTDLETVNIEMDVTDGESYKLQMFFTESCCNRGFNIVQDDELLVEDFAIHEHHLDDIWNINSREDGVLITHEFTAAGGTTVLNLGLSDTGDYPDNNGHISAITLEVMGSGLAGDFDGNGLLDAVDIDMLSEAVRTNSMDAQFDVNGDGAVDNGDRVVWVEELRKTWFGDSNLDGEFSSADFVAVFTTGHYEDDIAANSGWAEGDWDGDAEFDSSDFVAAFTAGGYELGPRADVQAVPEPSTLMLLVIGAAACGRRRFRR